MATAILVEDEPLLRAELRDHLSQQWPELTILAEAENGIDAIRLIGQHQPDIVFLDIQIPGINGIELAQHIPAETYIVFVTANAEHALKAFERGAIDYLVKPIDHERIAVTVARLKQRSSGAMSQNRKELSQLETKTAPTYLKWIKASIGDTVRLILINDVIYFNAADKYTRVVTKNAEAIIRLSLKQLNEQLDPNLFSQVHRSTIVNLAAIDRVTRLDGAMFIHLRERQERLPVSEAFMKQFKQM